MLSFSLVGFFESVAFFFYGLEGGAACPVPPLADNLAIEVWQPGLLRFRPAGLPWMPYLAWWLFWVLRVFRDPGYAVYVVRDVRTGRILHRSHVFPRWFRFPFMRPGDLQIGDTFTEPEHRGRGLAKAALARIAHDLARDGRTLWYVVQDHNAPSIRVAESCGFKKLGVGRRGNRFGCRLLGAFRIEHL